jgi:Mce-associated membrane protein
MAEASEPPAHSPGSAADAMALLAEAEAEALAAEAAAEAARARARAARLRREALAMAETVEDYGDAAAAAADADAGAAAIEEADEYYDEDDDDYYDDDDYDDEPDEGSDETSEVAGAESETSGAAWRRRVPPVSTIAKLAAVAIIGGFAWLSVYMELQHRDATQRRQREADFVAAARQGVTYMTSLDFNKARADVQRLIDTTTGEFRDDFQQRADDFASVVAQAKSITEGTVNGAAIESVDGNSASVLVLATSRITNSPPGKDEPPKTWRLKVTVTEVGGHYKMSKVEYVP